MSFFFNKQILNLFFFIYLFLGNTGSPLLPVNFSPVVAGRGCSLIATHGLLIAVASLIAEHGLVGSWARGLQQLQRVGSRKQA